MFCNPGGMQSCLVGFSRRFRPGTNHAVTRAVKRDDENGVDERSFRFYRDVLGFVDTIQPSPKTNRLIEQLADAAGSIGSNREEALGASSRREFIRYNEISLRGANETVRWLRACAAAGIGSRDKCVSLLDEGRQIARILAKIIITSKRRGGFDLPGDEPKPGT